MVVGTFCVDTATGSTRADRNLCSVTWIKARVRARGAKNQWFSERRTQLCRQKSRTQALWLCQFSGDWHPSYETMCPPLKPHYMRVMLVSNLAVENRFDR
jgi:hypothetical protein